MLSINILHFDLGYGKTRFLGLHYHDELWLNNRQQELFDRRYPHELYPEYYLLKVNQFDDIARDLLDEFRDKDLREAKQVLDLQPGGKRASGLL